MNNSYNSCGKFILNPPAPEQRNVKVTNHIAESLSYQRQNQFMSTGKQGNSTKPYSFVATSRQNPDFSEGLVEGLAMDDKKAG
jgi:hypothetical protein